MKQDFHDKTFMKQDFHQTRLSWKSWQKAEFLFLGDWHSELFRWYRFFKNNNKLSPKLCFYMYQYQTTTPNFSY